MRGVVGPAAMLLLSSSLGASGQGIGDRRSTYTGSDGTVSKYELLYGRPMYWSLTFLVGPEAHDGPLPNRAISTRGILSVLPRPGRDPDVEICEDTLRYCLALTNPAPEIGAEFFGDAPFRHLHEAEVVGAFTDEGFLFWSIDSAPPDPRRGAAPDRALADVVTRPDRFMGRRVTVRGRFRGANVFGDFASGAPPGEPAWVLRDGAFWVWITGREPKGRGWSLDPRSSSECIWRLEVEGTVERSGETLAVDARRVRLIGRDTDASCVEEARR